MTSSARSLRPLSTLYGLAGPFTTAYLDLDPDDVPGTVARWESALDAAGELEDEDIEAIDEVVVAAGDVHARGRVVVACGGRVLLTDDVPAGAGDRVSVGPLPDLYPYVARRLRVVPNLVLAPIDGSLRLLRVTPSGHQPLWPVAGEDVSFAQAFGRYAAEEAPEVVVVVGEYAECRQAVAVASQTRVLTTDVAMRMIEADPRDAAAIAAAVEATLRRHLQPTIDDARRAVAARGAATGPAAVVEALRMAQARTVVVGAGTELPASCWIGPRPTEFGLRDRDAARFGVQDPQHTNFDAALVRAVAATDTRLIVLRPGEAPPPGGIAASLRD